MMLQPGEVKEASHIHKIQEHNGIGQQLWQEPTIAIILINIK